MRRAEGPREALAALSQQGNPDEIDLGDEDEPEPDGTWGGGTTTTREGGTRSWVGDTHTLVPRGLRGDR